MRHKSLSSATSCVLLHNRDEANARIDKAQRFTDWAHRPLSQKQLEYALADVTHLRIIYEKLSAKLKATQRMGWLESEVKILTNPATYRLEPNEAWRRLKTRKLPSNMASM